MSIRWKQTLRICVAILALSSCTNKTGGKPEPGGQVATSTLTPGSVADNSIILSDDTVSCKLTSVIQLKIDGSTQGFDRSIIVTSREKGRVRIEWNGETASAPTLIVNDKAWVSLKGTSGVTLLYEKDWRGPIKKLVLCPREHS